MAQLDIFGNIVSGSEPTQPKKKAVVVPPQATTSNNVTIVPPVQNNLTVNDDTTSLATNNNHVATPPPTDNLVFNDGNIRVKIKLKTPPAASPTTNTNHNLTVNDAIKTNEDIVAAIIHNDDSTNLATAENIVEQIAKADTAIQPLTPTDAPNVASEMLVMTNEPELVPKRKRGRPRKIIDPNLVPVPKAKPATPEGPQKRGRKSFKEMDATAHLVEIPDDETLFSKQYYPMGTVAQWLHINTSLLRLWSNEFDIIKPRKNRKGDRLFRPEDVKNLVLIHQLLRVRKYSMEGARQYLKENKQKLDIQQQLNDTLTKFRGFLLQLKANLGE
ncbi:MAG: MerR family transcriptional regulator [Chitinophagaceae bacterium]